MAAETIDVKNVNPKNKKNVKKRVYYEKIKKNIKKLWIKNVDDKYTKLFIQNEKYLG